MLGTSSGSATLHTLTVYCDPGVDDPCINNDGGLFRAAHVFNNGTTDQPWGYAAPDVTNPCQITYEDGGSNNFPCYIADLSGQAWGYPVDYPAHSWVEQDIAWSNGAASDIAVNGDGSVTAYVTAASNLLSSVPDQIAPMDTNGLNDVYVSDSSGSTIASYNHVTDQAANGASQDVDITPDGRYVFFASGASNLIANDTNGSVKDIFRFDTTDGTILLVSRKTGGTIGNGNSIAPTASDNGRYVAFASDATNLVNGDTNGDRDIFLRDITSGTTTRMSLSSADAQSNGNSNSPAMSGGGQYVAYHSAATNLVTSDTNGAIDVFLRNLGNGNTTRVSLRNGGTQANGQSTAAAVSETGRYVAFQSLATNVVSNDVNNLSDIFVRDRTAGTTKRVSPEAQVAGGSFAATISADGRYVAFATDAQYELGSDDNNSASDVWEYDQTETDMWRMSTPASDDPGTAEWLDGASHHASMSDDGLVVAFLSSATNVLTEPKPNTLPDVYQHKWKNSRSVCIAILVSATLLAWWALSKWQQVAQTEECDDESAKGPGDPSSPPEQTHETPPVGPDVFRDFSNRESRLRIGVLNPITDKGWGYNKIKPKHGWDVAVRAQVAQVLAAPTAPPIPTGTAVTYVGTYVIAGGVDCVRRVVVDYGPRWEIGNQPYYIINTYAKFGTAW